MADNSSSKILVEDPKNSSPEEIDEQDLFTESTIDNSDSLLSVLSSLNENTDRMARSSMTTMGDSFAALSQQQRPAKRDSRAGNLEPRTCVNGSDSDGEDDVSTLLNSCADQDEIQEIESGTTLPANTQDNCKTEGEGELLNKLALDFTKDDKVNSPVSKQLDEIINKRWASKLSGNKLKELHEKYDRPKNCEKLAVPTFNPEIWGKLTHYGKKQDLRLSAIQNLLVKVEAVIAQSAQNLVDFRTKGANGGKFDTAAALTSQIDVIALLGHTNYELSLRRREAIKPNLNKEYGSLCFVSDTSHNLVV